MPQTLPQPGAAEPTLCRNCETPLQGAYCHACGQQDQRCATLRGQAAQWFASIATPGGRFFETLVGLLTSPGALTRAINEGKRQRFVSPFVTLLFAMLVLHGVQWLAGGPDQALTSESTVTASLERADTALEDYAAGEAEEAPGGPAFLRGEEQAARSALSAEERRERALSTQFFTDQARKAWNPVAEEPAPASWAASMQQALSTLPGLFPLLGWLLVPLLLPAMAGLFKGASPRGSLGHARFLAHATAFAALALAAGTALIAADLPFMPIAGILLAGLVAHTVFHLRGAYSLEWPGTVWRSAALLLASALAIAILTAGVTLWRAAL